MTSTYVAMMFVAASQAHGLPPGLLSALCFVESHHNTAAFNQSDGGSPSVGVCQIKLGTAQQIGFKGTAKQLAQPADNIFWAGKYLSLKLKKYDGDILKAVAAYNAGTHRYNTRGLTMNRKYVSKVFQSWSESR